MLTGCSSRSNAARCARWRAATAWGRRWRRAAHRHDRKPDPLGLHSLGPWSQPATPGTRQNMPTRAEAAISSPSRELQLLANDFLVHARAQVVLQTVGQREEQLVDPLVLDELLQKLPGLAAVVRAQELPNGVQGDLALEIQVHILQEVAHKLFHRRPPSFQVWRRCKGWRHIPRSTRVARPFRDRTECLPPRPFPKVSRPRSSFRLHGPASPALLPVPPGISSSFALGEHPV